MAALVVLLVAPSPRLARLAAGILRTVAPPGADWSATEQCFACE
jgi:hypothetical protein